MTIESVRSLDGQKYNPEEWQYFDKIVGIAKNEAGLSIPTEKVSMVFSRVRRRMKELGFLNLESYCSCLDQDTGSNERKVLISLLTTNVTSFFRESHHFTYFGCEILPTLIRSAKAGQRVRVWSAGCSSGQEPYTLAMICLDSEPDLERYDFRILGTDIDEKILTIARQGEYRAQQIEPVADHYKAKTFTRNDCNSDIWTVRSEVKSLVRLLSLNLLQEWPMQHPFDVIFCRNVLIYFDQDIQNMIIKKFEKYIKLDGHLFLGHSEKISPQLETGFDPIGNTIYSLAKSEMA